MAGSTPKVISEIRNNLYQIFHTIDKEIIDLVFQNASYKENIAYEHLQIMSEIVPRTQHSDPRDDCVMINGPMDNDDVNDEEMPEVIAQYTHGGTKHASNTHQYHTPRKPENLLEQLSHASVPPADINVVMSSTSVLHEDPAIIQTGPSSPVRPYSLFSDMTSATTTCTSTKPHDTLFHTNPYLGPAYHERNSTPFSLFMQPRYEVDTKRKKDEMLKIEKLRNYINYPTRHILILMRGLPGSGKSYKARQLCGVRGVIYSTDDYFHQKGKYQFNPSVLPDAHTWNQERARKAVECGYTPIFIDNTNMQKWEMKPYMLMAAKKNYEVKIIEPTTPWAWNPGQLASLNTHNVQKSKIENMMDRYEAFDSIEDVLNSKKKKKKNEPQHNNQSHSTVVIPETNEIHLDLAISPITRRHTQVMDVSVETEKEVVEIDDPVVSTVTSTPIVSDVDVHDHSVGRETRMLFNTDEEMRQQANDEIDFNMLSLHKDTVTDVYINPSSSLVPSSSVPLSSLPLSSLPLSSVPLSSVVHEQLSNETPQNEQQNICTTTTSTETSCKTSRNNVLEKDIINEDTSPGKIADLVKSYKSRSMGSDDNTKRKGTSSLPTLPIVNDFNLIDLTDDDEALHSSSSSKHDPYEKDQFHLNLQFIFECFPDLKKSYCEDWLKRYNGDLIRTCDYLSRLSQVEELPEDPDVPDIEELLPKQVYPNTNISLQDIFENQRNNKQPNDDNLTNKRTLTKVPGDILCNKDEEGDVTVVIPPSSNVVPVVETVSEDVADDDSDIFITLNHVATQSDFDIRDDDRSNIRDDDCSKKTVSGEIFYCDDGNEDVNEHNNDEEKISIAIDIKLAKELFAMFGSADHQDELRSEDLVVSLEKDMAKQIYDTWMGSVKARKRKIQTMLEDDERYAQELQREENKANNTDSPTNKKNKKKEKKKQTHDTPFSKHQDPRLYAGSFEPNAWKHTERLDVLKHGEERLTGRQVELQNELHGMFPGVAEDALNNILAAASYNIESAAVTIRASCGLKRNQAIQHVYASDVTTDWSKVTSPPRKQVKTNTHDVAGPSVHVVSPQHITLEHNDMYQTMTEGNQSYQDFRAEAELHKNMRTEYFQKAAGAFQEKRGLLAQYYADKAREHTLKMNEAHGRAAQVTLERKNRQYMRDGQVIDFHGLHADEALRALSNFLTNAQKMKHKSVSIITGRGIHSKGSFSTVKSAVMRALNTNNYEYKFHSNGGMLEVFLR